MTLDRTHFYRCGAFGVTFVILFLLSLPGHWIESLQTFMHPWWPWPSSGLVSNDLPIDKVVHSFLFLLSGALFIRGWKEFRQRWYLVAFWLFLFGLITELIQLYVPGRSASLGDLIADLVGIALGVGIAMLYLRSRCY